MGFLVSKKWLRLPMADEALGVGVHCFESFSIGFEAVAFCFSKPKASKPAVLGGVTGKVKFGWGYLWLTGLIEGLKVASA